MSDETPRRPRRDPFAEREARRVRPALETEAAPPSGRPRKDPFAEREARRARPAAGAEAPAPSGRVRRDPFAERESRRSREEPAPPPAASGRARKDPFAEREARRSREAPAAAPSAPAAPSGRVRKDPFADRQSRRAGQPAEAPPPAAVPAATAPRPAGPPARKVENPSCLILAVPDLEDGRFTSHDRDVIGGARALADALSGAVVVVLCVPPEGPRPDLDPGEAGADRVVELRHAAFAGWAGELRAAALRALVERERPRHVLLPDDPVGGGDVGRRLAALLGERPAGNVQRLARDRVTRRGRGGLSDFALAPPRVLLIAPEAADPVMDERFEARRLDPVPLEGAPRVADRGLAATDPNAVPIAEADFIVSAGNGVTDWNAFHRLAGALAASEGGSRVVVDAGKLPRHRQVGASGTLVEPRCYLAVGIAGASQHLQGIQRCERVVAVNTDLHADMVKRADLSIILDAQHLMPELERIAKERRADD